MSKFYKIWKQYLAEGQASPHQIYCDMDGVLVDFVAGVISQVNEDINNAKLPSRKEAGGVTN